MSTLPVVINKGCFQRATLIVLNEKGELQPSFNVMGNPFARGKDDVPEEEWIELLPRAACDLERATLYSSLEKPGKYTIFAIFHLRERWRAWNAAVQNKTPDPFKDSVVARLALWQNLVSEPEETRVFETPMEASEDFRKYSHP